MDEQSSFPGVKHGDRAIDLAKYMRVLALVFELIPNKQSAFGLLLSHSS